MAIQAQHLYSENLGSCSQDWMENNNNNICSFGFNELYFNLQQQQRKQQQLQQSLQQQQQQQRNQTQTQTQKQNHVLYLQNNQMGLFSQSIGAEIEKQRQEIDQLITLQNDRLRLVLQEQRRQQLVTILKKYESKTQVLLRQKDEEIAKALSKTMELEEFMRKVQMESQTWEKAARENEALVVSLNNTIEQLRESSCLFEAEDAESCCCQTGENQNRGDEANGGGGGEQVERKMVCKNCCVETSCFVFLPCRHLCSCKSCEAFLDSCPLCKMVKKASIEILI